MVPTFTLEPIDGVGVQLCPCGIAMVTPQAFTMASPTSDINPSGSSPRPRAKVRTAAWPRSVRFEPVGFT